MDAEKFIGAWDLVQWRIRFSDDRPPTYPYGEDAGGQLIYAASGRMSVTVMRSDRPGMSVTNIRQAPLAEKAAAFDSFFHYAGRWSLGEGVVQHDVAMALNPNFVGTLQTREARLEGETLTLVEEAVTGSGATMWNELTWRRAATAGSTT